jgi:hypothetical protein
MPLSLDKPPAGAFELLPGPLSQFLHEEWKSITVLPPQPIYTATIEDLLKGQLFEHPRLMAWQYILRQGDVLRGSAEVAVAPTKAGEGETLEYSAYQTGPFPRLVLDAVSFATTLPSVATADYKVRILRLPWVFLAAVWLARQNDDLLIPLRPVPHSLEEKRVYREAELTSALSAIASQRFNYANTAQDR